jgi:hypothetical protein
MVQAGTSERLLLGMSPPLSPGIQLPCSKPLKGAGLRLSSGRVNGFQMLVKYTGARKDLYRKKAPSLGRITGKYLLFWMGHNQIADWYELLRNQWY